MIDIVILSYAKTPELKKITEDCIDSLISSEPLGTFNIIILESHKNIYYSGVKTVHPDMPFNYNAYCNFGAKLGKSEHICFCNNDLIFSKGWASELLKFGLPSMSPKCPNNPLQSDFTHLHLGTETSRHISGWCIFLKRSLWDSICGFDEDFEFWCADDSYREQLKFHNINHYLVATSLVTHLGSQTINTMPVDLVNHYTKEQARKYNKKFNKNLFGLNGN